MGASSSARCGISRRTGHQRCIDSTCNPLPLPQQTCDQTRRLRTTETWTWTRTRTTTRPHLPQRGNGSAIRAARSRRAVGIISDAVTPTAVGPAGIGMPSEARIIIKDDGVVPGVGVEDGIVSLETNNDFATGAPPVDFCMLYGPLPTRAIADEHLGAREEPPEHSRQTHDHFPHTKPRFRHWWC